MPLDMSGSIGVGRVGIVGFFGCCGGGTTLALGRSSKHALPESLEQRAAHDVIDIPTSKRLRAQVRMLYVGRLHNGTQDQS